MRQWPLRLTREASSPQWELARHRGEVGREHRRGGRDMEDSEKGKNNNNRDNNTVVKNFGLSVQTVKVK